MRHRLTTVLAFALAGVRRVMALGEFMGRLKQTPLAAVRTFVQNHLWLSTKRWVSRRSSGAFRSPRFGSNVGIAGGTIGVSNVTT